MEAVDELVTLIAMTACVMIALALFIAVSYSL